uniref:Brain protein I3 n=1 Tax=Syphacia muris TaxID=451379 RepID=A0A0N5AHI7_9BILA
MVVAEAVQKMPQVPSCNPDMNPPPYPYPDNRIPQYSGLAAAGIPTGQQQQVMQMDPGCLQRMYYDQRPVVVPIINNVSVGIPRRRCRHCNGELVYEA